MAHLYRVTDDELDALLSQVPAISIDGPTSVGKTTTAFPGLRGPTPRALRFQLESYLRNAVDRDVPEQGLAVRKPEAMLAWLQAYAAATASCSALLDAATPGQADKPARSTSIAYRDVLTQLWLLDPVPAWAPLGSSLARLGQAPQHHLADPALAARLLGLTVDALLDGGSPVGPQAGTMLGHLFESLAALCVRVAAQAAEATVGHLRTRNGDHEVDLIVVRDDGKVLAVEVKLAATVQDRDTTPLQWLARPPVLIGWSESRTMTFHAHSRTGGSPCPTRPTSTRSRRRLAAPRASCSTRPRVAASARTPRRPSS
ncbi:MAG: DUF4143 domain-containing protein [Cellulomonas sp.]|nr:DUF4143 domain-containing protein [Cellulomonas sp.]